VKLPLSSVSSRVNPSLIASIATETIHNTEFLLVNVLENGHFRDGEGGERITLRFILEN
jgi:hypothetical protein